MTGAPSRPVVLVLVSHYLPAFRAGGPIRSLSNMVDALHGEVDFRIFTGDRDYGRSEPLPGVPRGRWCEVGGAQVFYGSARHRAIPGLVDLFREVRPDVVYLNSFFNRSLSILPLVLRRAGLLDRSIAWLIAPRGEFSAGALAIKSAKKSAFLSLSRAARLHEGLTWQASSDIEADDIRRAVGRVAATVRVAPNPTARVEPLTGDPAASAPPEPLAVCFLSRISPKKNLRYAIEVVKRVRRPIRFDIYGRIEDASYWSDCEKLIASAPASCTIRWIGEVAHEGVRETLARYDLLLLPTLGENFGHVIFESLAAGVPVLLSDRTPWRDLDARGSGWVRSLDDAQGFVDVLEAIADRDPAARHAARQAAHAHAIEVSRSETTIGASRALFLGAAGARRATYPSSKENA